MEPATKSEKQGLMATSEPSDSSEAETKATVATAQSLRQSGPSLLRRLGVPTALLLIPIFYITLVIITASLNHKEQSSFGDTVIEILQIASTLWPVTFTAVLGPFLKTIALLKAKRGTTLSSLEFLLTSQTTASALLNLLTLRRTREVTAVAIAGVWLLGPLGGQAALRSIHIRQNIITTKMPALHYLGNNQSEIEPYYSHGAYVHYGASGRSNFIAGMRGIYSAPFSSPDILVLHANTSSPNFNNVVRELGGTAQASRLGYRDLWRNVRVPFLELLPGYDDENPTSWVTVPLDEIVPYVSLIGLPIRTPFLNGAGNLSMTVQFHYQTLNCGEDLNGASWVKNGSTSLFLHNTTSPVRLALQSYETIFFGLESNKGNPNRSDRGYPNIWFDIANTSAARQQLKQRGVQLEAQSNLQLVLGGECVFCAVDPCKEITRLRLCDISISYIEMAIGCTRVTPDADLICRAVRIRRVPFHPNQGNLTALSSLRMAQSVLFDIPFTGATEHGGQKGPSTVEYYLRDPTSTLSRQDTRPWNTTLDRDIQSCYTHTSARLLERRLATVLNTFIVASYNLTALTGGDGVIIEDAEFPWKSSTATWTQFANRIYVVDWLWLSITVLSTAALVVCAVANVIIRLRIKAPDFLTSVAGLIRDTPFIRISNQVGSGFSGEDRLKVLGEVRVQIRDVYPDRDVGRIALTTDLTHQKLELDRDYE
ncbi:hypothetical protein NW752_002314 [Fusarium irregulare]|uniref:Uncharacterized protein n=1 Tax=Fusarium irregulare TaxID=2494466 RepID=A0A9W8PGN4_9HYPO|nr:hypothetical protein NW766_011031 [Fusarium irregulare]KAJ4024861.1 hypothetical protein NW752_002314 [Fusarium irregulare]